MTHMTSFSKMDPADFRDFTFTNPARFLTDMNPDFFTGTRVEGAVKELVVRDNSLKSVARQLRTILRLADHELAVDAACVAGCDSDHRPDCDVRRRTDQRGGRRSPQHRDRARYL